MAIDAISTLFPPTAGGAPDGAAAEPAAPGFGTLVEGLVAHTEGTVRTANAAVGQMLDQAVTRFCWPGLNGPIQASRRLLIRSARSLIC